MTNNTPTPISGEEPELAKDHDLAGLEPRLGGEHQKRGTPFLLSNGHTLATNETTTIVLDTSFDHFKIGLDDVVTITEGERTFAKYEVVGITLHSDGKRTLRLEPLGDDETTPP